MFARDTHPDAQRVRDQVLRRMSGPEKLAAVDELTSFVHSLALAGLRQRMPDASPAEIERAHFELVLGAELATRVLAHRESLRANPRSHGMTTPARLVMRIAELLDKLGIP